jgi:hypothetical protein
MHGSARIILAAAALVLISSQAARAVGGIVGADFDSEVLLGCNEPTCSSGSTNATAEVWQEMLNSYTLRFGLNVNADDSAGGGLVLENGAAAYHTNFTVDLDNYDLILSTFRAGALRRNADALGCEGSVSLGAMSAPTLTINDQPGPDLSDLVLPGTSIENGGGDADLEIVSDTQRKTIEMRNRPGEDHFSLSLAMNAAALSDSCEVSARLGAPNAATTGCSACEYPGDGNRDIDQDGLFVTVTVVDRCGDGVVQAPEQCDLGVDRNGDSDTCCLSDCTFRGNDHICRGSTSSGACDPYEVCSGDSALCPADVKAPAGTPCEDDGDPCTEDVCDDGGGQCLHTEIPVCPERCGNGQIDPGEECDFGKIDNGSPTNCCDDTCMFRPNGASCTDEAFCNGEESCSDGVCTGSTGNPCSDLGSCAVCDEANNVCDTTGCAVTPTPTQIETPVGSTPTATVTPEQGTCVGDCDGDRTVDIKELISGVDIALHNRAAESCSAFDADADDEVALRELIEAVGNAVNGCPF